MDHWESLIAERMRPCEKLAVEDYEHTEGRKRQHKAWASSAFGKFSMQMRGKRYRLTEKGKANARKKSNAYYARHKDEPEFKARRSEYQKAFRARHKAGKLRQVDYTLTLHGETIVAHVLTTRRDAA